MELVNEFTVKRPIEQTWNTLTDVPTITPCLPGAALEAIDGNTYSGVVRLKVGPILANFKGDASFIEKDDVKHRAVLDAKGRDTGNKGNAAAVIIAQLESIDANTTKVVVSTDLKITGKFAQFGRGAMQEISNKLLAEFVSNLEKLTTADAAAQAASGDAASTAAAVESGAAPASTANAATGASTITAPKASDNDNVLDLGKYAGGAMAKRFAPFAGGLLLLLLLLMRRRRH
jgi:carbon monoxide dehydrogenase subunit G